MVMFHLVTLFHKLRNKRSLGVACALSLLAVSVLGNASCYYYFDNSPDKEVGVGDALWYSAISITTIGYGDHYAQSTPARLSTVFFVVFVGLAAFSVVLGMGIEWVSEQASKSIRGLGTAVASNHVIIVNFPSETRVRQIIQELKSDSGHNNREIVIVADSIDMLPFTEKNVVFIRGPVLEHDTYERARINDAEMAIVLATSYSDPCSDAVVASVVSVIDNMKSDTHIVAECLNPNHRKLFASVNCDAIIYSMQISGNLLAQEVHDPGVAQLIDTITSNQRGTTLFTLLVPDGVSVSYHELAKQLLDIDVNLICVNRQDESLTALRTLTSQPGDRLVYAGMERWNWDQLQRALKQ